MAVVDKIMSIYYGEDKLPYKDIDRQVHYPIGSGNIFTGENNTTKFRFYVDKIGGGAFTWLATIKLPDGSLVYRLASEVSESGYVEVDISSFYTQIVGAIFVGLTGYAGDINITEEDGTYEVSGNPDKLVTGAVKVMVNYSPQILNIGNLTPSDYEQLVAMLNLKLGKQQGIPFYQNITSIGASEVQKSELKNNEVVFDLSSGVFYKFVASSNDFISLKTQLFVAESLVSLGNLTKYAVGQIIYIKNANDNKFIVITENGNYDIVCDFNDIADIPNKVDKTNDPNQVYGTDEDGEQATIPYSESANENTIAKRTNDGAIYVETPDENNKEATNRGYVLSKISAEVSRADNKYETKDDAEAEHQNIQSQIDAIVSKSDVSDIVDTFEDLEDYDTSELQAGNIINVLKDETHDDASSYYRFNPSKAETLKFDYIGSVASSYTKAESDDIFLTKLVASATYQKHFKMFDHVPLANELEEGQVGYVPSIELGETVIGSGLRKIVESGVETLEVDKVVVTTNETQNLGCGLTCPKIGNTDVSKIYNAITGNKRSYIELETSVYSSKYYPVIKWEYDRNITIYCEDSSNGNQYLVKYEYTPFGLPNITVYPIDVTYTVSSASGTFDDNTVNMLTSSNNIFIRYNDEVLIKTMCTSTGLMYENDRYSCSIIGTGYYIEEKAQPKKYYRHTITMTFSSGTIGRMTFSFISSKNTGYTVSQLASVSSLIQNTAFYGNLASSSGAKIIGVIDYVGTNDMAIGYGIISDTHAFHTITYTSPSSFNDTVTEL